MKVLYVVFFMLNSIVTFVLAIMLAAKILAPAKIFTDIVRDCLASPVQIEGVLNCCPGCGLFSSLMGSIWKASYNTNTIF
jgi:hypothetical protein